MACPPGYRQNASGKCVAESALRPEEELAGTMNLPPPPPPPPTPRRTFRPGSIGSMVGLNAREWDLDPPVPGEWRPGSIGDMAGLDREKWGATDAPVSAADVAPVSARDAIVGVARWPLDRARDALNSAGVPIGRSESPEARSAPDQATLAGAMKLRENEQKRVAAITSFAAGAAKAVDKQTAAPHAAVTPVGPEPDRAELGPAASAYAANNPGIPTGRNPAQPPPPGAPAVGSPAAPAASGAPAAPSDGRMRFVRSASGAIVATNRPPEGDGAGWMDEATALAGIRDPRGKDVLTSKPAGPGAFSDMGGAPYSEKMSALMAEPPTTPLSEPSYVIRQNRSSIGPWSESKTETLSGVEQATSRREWLEGRQAAEQAQEVGDAERAANIASFARVAEEAKIDPLALAHIQATGRVQAASAPQYLQQEYESGRIANARAAHQFFIPKVEAIVRAMQVATTPEQRASLQQQMQALERLAREAANIELGRWLPEVRPDLFSALLGLAGAGAGAAAGGGAPPG